MIGIMLENHQYYNETADIVRLYLGKQEIKQLEKALAESQSFFQGDNVLITSRLEVTDKSCICISRYQDAEKYEEETLEITVDTPDKKALKRTVKKSMYKLLSRVFKKEFPWGILTGIRPVKIVHELMDNKFSASAIHNILTEEYLISSDRAELAREIAEIERPFVYPLADKEISIYIGIPFCPSRCHYCSFTSNSIVAYKEYVEPYLKSLMEEISRVAEYLNNEGYKVQTIYIGGGTPTALSAEQLEQLIKCINRSFGRQFSEFTCEAGRPDSITKEKLRVLYENGVDRISINPQTMNDETLKCIGRAHNSAQIEESYSMARAEGFDNINMDLILGLPGENMEQLSHTLKAIGDMNPESVTVHTMAIKRASLYNENFNNLRIGDDENISQMMEYSKQYLRQLGMRPYYLYRQKHMLQNLENIGFSKKGFECIYNMLIMEEKQTIVAFGADAVTKIVINRENRIERQHNIKDIKLYIENIEEMISDKLDILEELRKTY